MYNYIDWLTDTYLVEPSVYIKNTHLDKTDIQPLLHDVEWCDIDFTDQDEVAGGCSGGCHWPCSAVPSSTAS